MNFTKPFMSGQTVTISALDSLLVSVCLLFSPLCPFSLTENNFSELCLSVGCDGNASPALRLSKSTSGYSKSGRFRAHKRGSLYS